ncbi:MAG TPA: fluoride efflux transporter CrcB [Chthonomonadales bacterium]|nr:fluoride efflux transporter CrcB [Chthonomonadales bacterium]
MKEITKYLVIGLGGFIGANARYIIGGWVQQKWGSSFPYGTFVINITGSFILGLFATLALRFTWSEYLRLWVAIGFVGAYTTFSTFEYETLRLIMEGRQYFAAAFNVLGSVMVGFLQPIWGLSQGAC